MKIFYVGSACSQAELNDIIAHSKVKPCPANQNFQGALIKGFSAYPELEMTIASVDPMASYPTGRRLLQRKRLDRITECAVAQIVPAVNLPIIKQWNQANGIVKLLRKWLQENRSEQNKCVLVYGFSPQRDRKILKACKEFGCKVHALVTDVPSALNSLTKYKNPIKRFLLESSQRAAIEQQGKFDGYIYLTDAMKDEVAPGKPYIVVETLVDTTIFNGLEGVKASPPALLYAGTLFKKYGIDMILESFACVKSPCELWLFGSGDYEEEIKRRAEADPRIRFFGCVSREEVLRREKEATLLLNIRNADDEYTKYSFPSKMVEYMLSGTPLLTTKLPGVPDEYDAYCFTITERCAQNIAAAIDGILQDENLQTTGVRARDFVTRHKNGTVQAGKIIDFLKRQIAKG